MILPAKDQSLSALSLKFGVMQFTRIWKQTAVLAAVLSVLLLSACARPLPVEVAAVEPVVLVTVTPTLVSTTQPSATPAITVIQPSPTTEAPTAIPPAASPTPTPFYSGPLSPACGQILPVLPQTDVSHLTTALNPDPAALARVDSLIPAAARDAWNHILDSPETVGLAAYRIGQEADGVYLNADAPMPLGSIVKVVHLVAYAEAAAAGELDPASLLPVTELEKYYQPGLDLGAHNRALAELETLGRVVGNPPQVRLEDVVWMMMRFSSNAAMDYLHLLLGQERIEQTAVSLGLTTQTAPCPFLAQFLAMGNITRGFASDTAAVQSYLEDPAKYGQEAMLLADAFIQDPDFRAAQNEWRREMRRPSVSTQRFFTENLNPQGTAGEYAALMARLAQNGLSSA
ncbi:MAG: serine hydrolase, partial [Chloroflexota bacterium]